MRVQGSKNHANENERDFLLPVIKMKGGVSNQYQSIFPHRAEIGWVFATHVGTTTPDSNKAYPK